MGWTIVLQFVVAPLIAAIVAILTVTITQHWTAVREAKMAFLKEKREAYIGALEAEREFWIAKRESQWLADRVQFLGKRIYECAQEQELCTTKLKDTSTSVEQRQGYEARSKAFFEESKKALEEKNEKIEKSIAAEARLNASILNLDYWLSRVEMYCPSQASTALKAMYGTKVNMRSEEEMLFIQTARQDLNASQPSLIPWQKARTQDM